jgi:outer membrane immunogenic protein
MYRYLAPGIVGIALSGGCAHAADMITKAPPTVEPAMFTWTGFYGGANIGYSRGRLHADHFLFGTPISNDTTNPVGVIGGGQFGFNWQTANLLLGIETDFQGSAEKASNTLVDCAASNPICGGQVTVTHTDKLVQFGTTRGRIGYVLDRWMVYGTGGVAYAKFDGTAFGTCVPGPCLVPSPINTVIHKSGWVVGAGLEAALAKSWSWKFEYLHMDYGTINVTNSTTGENVRDRGTDDILRAGINYRFNVN